MGIFNELGRQAEQFKQKAKEAAEEHADAKEKIDYQCQNCDAQFQTEYDECPECGAQEITSRPTTN